jgi:hypothetical protein
MAGYWQPAMHVTVRKGLESTFAETLKTEVGLGRKSLYNLFSQTMIVKGGNAATKVAQVHKAGEGNIHITTGRAIYVFLVEQFNVQSCYIHVHSPAHIPPRKNVAKAGCVKKTQRCTYLTIISMPKCTQTYLPASPGKSRPYRYARSTRSTIL